MSTEELRAFELLHRVSHGRVATSLRALPFMAPARHVVADGALLLRMHAGLGRTCGGGVVTYGVDNFGSGDGTLWSVQLTGTAEIIDPSAQEIKQFDSCPILVDGQPFEPVFMRLESRFIAVHTLDYAHERRSQHIA
ncbi:MULTISPECIES: pyridoxamine 5'-phosphate oxidase family protein [unclassified Streptomyces]|uniref:pyridoxamine 5'-phosphate oxidase family protein n=1 Tax=unclassified Streptomyces TaxID=2593676 RepID=UPI00381F7E25